MSLCGRPQYKYSSPPPPFPLPITLLIARIFLLRTFQALQKSLLMSGSKRGATAPSTSSVGRQRKPQTNVSRKRQPASVLDSDAENCEDQNPKKVSPPQRLC